MVRSYSASAKSKALPNGIPWHREGQWHGDSPWWLRIGSAGEYGMPVEFPPVYPWLKPGEFLVVLTNHRRGVPNADIGIFGGQYRSVVHPPFG